MAVAEFDAGRGLLGGALIGFSTVLVLALNGRIAGISGVVARALARPHGDTAWRVAFLAGMIGGGAALFEAWPATAAFGQQLGWGPLLLAGFLVGLGTRVGGGCTSGHGVCGLARGSRQSLVATLVFMGVAAAATYVVRHLLGVGGEALA